MHLFQKLGKSGKENKPQQLGSPTLIGQESKGNRQEQQDHFRVISKSDGKLTILYCKTLEEANQVKTQFQCPLIQSIQRQVFNSMTYEQLMQHYKKKKSHWVDQSFKPQSSSIQGIDGINPKKCTWKRIIDILKNPKLFDSKIEPKDVVQGSLGNCYFLSALSSLAENQKLIKNVFGNQEYNQYGIYRVTMRIDGVIQDILVDDYIPCDSKGRPLFSQPIHNQFWVLILEKAWAKVHSGYANIISGQPVEVFKAVTYAPSEVFILKSEKQKQKKEALWKKILQNSNKDSPCCCGTKNSQSINWQKIDLVEGHAYSLIHAAQVVDNSNKKHKIVILRNPWGHLEWNGQASEHDEQFWNKINPSDKKWVSMYLKKSNDGVFIMLFNDFCYYFNQVHFCLYDEKANYLATPFVPVKNGTLYTFKVENSSNYIFQLHQQGIRGQDPKKIQDGLCRATMVLAKVEEKDYIFIDGVMKMNEEDTPLEANLKPGEYVLYAKYDRSRVRGLFPTLTSLSVYSQNSPELIQSSQNAHPNFLKKTFFMDGIQNGKRKLCGENMYLATKLLYKEGGYGYIVIVNDSQSHKLVIQVDEKVFLKHNFSLKKPFKGAKNKILEILPGESDIILARVQNKQVSKLQFPPPLKIKRKRYF